MCARAERDTSNSKNVVQKYPQTYFCPLCITGCEILEPRNQVSYLHLDLDKTQALLWHPRASAGFRIILPFISGGENTFDQLLSRGGLHIRKKKETRAISQWIDWRTNCNSFNPELNVSFLCPVFFQFYCEMISFSLSLYFIILDTNIYLHRSFKCRVIR